MKHLTKVSNARAAWFSMALATSALVAPAAFAEAPVQTAPAASVPAVEEVVVTAEKRSQRLVEVPAAVSVVSAERIDQLGLHDLRGISRFTPGLNFGSTGELDEIVIRGISAGESFSPLSGIIVDGAPLGCSMAIAICGAELPEVNLDDMARVEVLPGPQGTLYGASSMGGLISYVSKTGLGEPFGGEMTVQGSSTAHGEGSYLARGAINVPLVADRADFRLSGIYQHNGGFIDNQLTGQTNVNDVTTKGFRASLALTPVDDLTIKLSAWLQWQDRSSADFIDYAFGSTTPIVGPYDQGAYLLTPVHRDSQHYVSDIEWGAGPVVLSSITSYSVLNTHISTDFSYDFFGQVISALFGAPATAVDSVPHTEKVTQEFRLSSPSSSPIHWLGGFFYTHENSTYDVPLTGVDANGQPIPGLDPAFEVLAAPLSYTAYAVFGNFTIPLTSRLQIGGGLRNTWENDRTHSVTSGVVATLFGLAGTSDTRGSDSHLDFAANIRYQLASNTFLYGRIASGFRPGGGNSVGVPGVPPSYEPDSLINYETGIKSVFWDGRASVNLDAFYIDWSKIQLQGSASGFAYFANAGSATSKGVEFSGTLAPAPGLTLVGAFAYTDARLSDDAPILGATAGSPLTNSPKWTASLSGEYRHPLANDWDAVVGGAVSYTGTRYAGFDGSTQDVQFVLRPYTMVDLHVGVENDRYKLTAFAHNVGDVRGETSALTQFGVASVGITRPRELGVEVSAKF